MSKSFYITISFILCIAAILWFFYPPSKPPIKIGLMVSLTGSSPELGREIRDGAFLAVEEINREGGVKGRKLELIIKDNKENVEIAKINYLELIDEGVVAVIGPATSTRARELLPLINEEKVLTISPTVSGNIFAKRDDYFIRLEPTNTEFGRSLGKYVKDKIKPKRVLLMVDERNPVYTADFAGSFIMQLNKSSSIFSIPIEKNISDFNALIQKALKYRPDFILMVTDIFNASIITQKIRTLNPKVKLAIAPWARFYGFISFSGPFAKGVLSVGFYDESPKNEKYMIFRAKFMQKFGYPPDSSVINSYNAVMLIKEAIMRGAEPDKIKKNIINGTFRLPLGELKIDRHGDAEIKPFVVEIRKGMFERVEYEDNT